MDSQRISRLDIAGFKRVFFDVKVVNPYAPSNQTTPLSATIAMKMRKRGNMTNASMKLNMPLSLHLFSFALEALDLKPQQAIKRLAYLLSAKWNQAYSLTRDYI